MAIPGGLVAYPGGSMTDDLTPAEAASYWDGSWLYPEEDGRDPASSGVD